jgi:lipopolysaccharide transport system permease protein
MNNFNKIISLEEQQWTTVIKPRNGWVDLHFSELWHYRDLVLLFVRRDFIAVYKQTILGPIWFFLQPIFSTVVFTIIFGKIAKISTDGLPQVLFYLSGTIMWNYFSTCLTKTSDTFVANSGIFGKVYFPRMAVPVSVVITNLLTFGIQFLLFLILLFCFLACGTLVRLNWWFLFTPVLLIEMAMLALGFGIIISSMTVKYRDLSYLVSFGVQLWMYATPIVYPLSQIPANWQWLYILNPMSAIVETFRFAFLGAGMASLSFLGLSFAITIVILAIGIILFSRVEKTFMDTV